MSYFLDRYSTSKSDKSFYSLTWTVKLEHNHDTVYFAHCFPYTYTDLQVSQSFMPPSLSFAEEISLLFCKCWGLVCKIAWLVGIYQLTMKGGWPQYTNVRSWKNMFAIRFLYIYVLNCIILSGFDVGRWKKLGKER